MAEIDFPAEIRALRSTFASIEQVSDVAAIKEDIAELSEMAGVPDLWDDPAEAQKITSKLSHRQTALERLEKLESRIDDLEVLVELAQDEADAESKAEAAVELESLRASLSQLEVVTLLSGEYDEREAVVTIRSGAGEWMPRTSLRCCCACICAGRNAMDTPPRCWTPPMRRKRA